MAHTISALQKDLIAKVQAQREAKRRAQDARRTVDSGRAAARIARQPWNSQRWSRR